MHMDGAEDQMVVSKQRVWWFALNVLGEVGVTQKSLDKNKNHEQLTRAAISVDAANQERVDELVR